MPKKGNQNNSKFPLYFDKFSFINSRPFLKGRSFENDFFKADPYLSHIVTPKYHYLINQISLFHFLTRHNGQLRVVKTTLGGAC